MACQMALDPWMESNQASQASTNHGPRRASTKRLVWRKTARALIVLGLRQGERAADALIQITPKRCFSKMMQKARHIPRSTWTPDTSITMM